MVHGGDLFYRSRVPTALVEMAMAPLVQVADIGVPVYLVPGNHERSKIPLHLYSAHPNIHIFHEPGTFLFAEGDVRVALVGFPFARGIRDKFGELLRQTAYHDVSADIRLLCIHQTVEGASVGPSNYTFRSGRDIIRGMDIPTGFAAVLAGHIHRNQVLTHDLAGNRLTAPVIYPGAIERTSFAERQEQKHYALLEVAVGETHGGEVRSLDFIRLPTRPMVMLTVDLAEIDHSSLEDQIRKQLTLIDPDAVIRIKFLGDLSDEHLKIINAANLRKIVPPSMNISISPHPHPMTTRKKAS